MTDNKESLKKVKTTQVYSPEKQYTWSPDLKFELTGAEFGLWLNTVRGILASDRAIEIRMAIESNAIIERLMKSGVESGDIKEVEE